MLFIIFLNSSSIFSLWNWFIIESIETMSKFKLKQFIYDIAIEIWSSNLKSKLDNQEIHLSILKFKMSSSQQT